MSLLHTMSFAGSTAVVIYLLLYFLTKRYLSLLWHKVYLTVNILLFLVPVAWFKTEYTELVNKSFGYEAWYQKTRSLKMWHSSATALPLFILTEEEYNNDSMLVVKTIINGRRN